MRFFHKVFFLLPLLLSTATAKKVSLTPSSTHAATKGGVGEGQMDLKVPKKSKIPLRWRPAVDNGLRYGSNDWLINFLTTPFSFILRRIAFHFLFNVGVAYTVAHYYENGYPQFSIPMVGHSLLASSLGLLLSYRTNSGYARFWVSTD